MDWIDLAKGQEQVACECGNGLSDSIKEGLCYVELLRYFRRISSLATLPRVGISEETASCLLLYEYLQNPRSIACSQISGYRNSFSLLKRLFQIFVLSCLAAFVVAAPQQKDPVRIVKQDSQVNGDGSYSYRSVKRTYFICLCHAQNGQSEGKEVYKVLTLLPHSDELPSVSVIDVQFRVLCTC